MDKPLETNTEIIDEGTAPAAIPTPVKRPLDAKQFRNFALQRIKSYETFLELCGITPVAGSESEFHFNPQASPNYRKLASIREFAESPFVEALKRDDTLYNVGEIVLGNGPRGNAWKSPGERHPSTIVRATESAQKIVQQCDTYGMDINFGEEVGVKRIRSLQSNISFWRTSDKSPLFIGTPVLGELENAPNALTRDCAASLLEAQKALIALVSPQHASFRRYEAKNAVFSITHGKTTESTIALRDNPLGSSPFTNPTSCVGKTGRSRIDPASFYFEDRLASSEAEPALAMLITLGGMVNGLKKYMRDHGLVDDDGKPEPEKLKHFINSPAFSEAINESHRSDALPRSNDPKIAVPQNFRDALRNLQDNPLAIEIMGKEFYEAFREAYAQKARLEETRSL